MLVVLVLFTQSLSNWIYFDTTIFWNNRSEATVQAAWPVEENKLVAIFVQQSIYDSLQTNLQRYALQYIQARFPRTKALVFPVDTTTITANEIQKILSNLYYGWEKDVPSTLIGTVLIGDIPLPTIEVTENGKTETQPSILPYTDLEKPTYIYDTTKSIFIQTTNADKKQELFHGLIKFDRPDQYNAYFEKLKAYVRNPSSFASQKIWYDDFIQLQRNFTDQMLPLYAKKQLFDEDLLYHRYTPAIFNILQEDSNNNAFNIFTEQVRIPASTPSDTSTELYTEEEKAYNESLAKRQGDLAKQANDSTEAIKQAAQWENIPTMVMGQSILQQVKDYNDIYAPEYGDIMYTQIASQGRRTGASVANNITKIASFDKVSAKLLFDMNARFEETLDAKITGDAMSLDIPLPLLTEKFACKTKTKHVLCNACDENATSCTKENVTSVAAIGLLGWGATAATIAAWWGLCKMTIDELEDKKDPPTRSEVFYFWKNAIDITSADQTTRFRGTYGNITNAGQALASPWSDLGKSIWSTYWFTNQQILASRWYNVMKADLDGDVLNALVDNDKEGKTACWKHFKKVAKKNSKSNDNATIKFFADKFWGWHTPLNLTGAWPMILASDLRERAYNPTYNRYIWGALFDIAWSALEPVTGLSYSWTNALAVEEFGRVHIVSVPKKGIFDWVPLIGGLASALVAKVSNITGLFTKTLGSDEKEVIWCEDTNPVIPVSNYDYLTNVGNTKVGMAWFDAQVVTPKSDTSFDYTKDATCKTRVIYKTIPSIVKHTSPTPEEVKGMNITTPARWVDSERYVSFTTLAWNIIELPYPNLYDVPVYKKEGTVWKLQNPDEIKGSIIIYLQDIVKEYNTKLIAENEKIPWYLSGNTTWFALLAAQNRRASPANRSYTTLPEDFYISLMSDEALTQLADILYIKNTPWQSKIDQPTVGQMIDQIVSTIHIENKIQTILQRNLVEWENGIGVNTNGYEVAYIRSAGVDTISSTTSVPSFIQDAMNKIDAEKTKKAVKGNESNAAATEKKIDAACNVWSDGTVPLLQRPKALTCWRKELQTNVKEGKIIQISYKNARGPVYALDQFSQQLKESYQDYMAYVHGVINPSITATTQTDQDSANQAAINSFTIWELAIQTATQTIIRGWVVPIGIAAKNKNGEDMPSLFEPVQVSVDQWYFPDASFDENDRIQQMSVTDLSQPIFLDTTGIPSLTTIHITASGDNINATGSLLVVDGTLRVQVNGETTNELSLQLPATSYVNTAVWLPIVYENRLPYISLTITDPNNKPIHTAAQITTDKWLLDPCDLTSNDQWKQCTKKTLRDINWNLTIRFLPTMKAWTDTIRIAIPWLPERTIQVTIQPADPYKVEVQQATGGEFTAAAFSVYDTRGNLVVKPTSVQYSLIGNDIRNLTGTTEDTITTTNWETTLPIEFGTQWGANYIYATLPNTTDTIPGYIRRDTPVTLWPKWNLNAVYLTLLGKDWWNPEETEIPDIIMSSTRLLAVTTTLKNPVDTEPADLEPLRSYGGGKTVGEAWRMEFDRNIIHYWDPMLQHAGATKPLQSDTTAVKIAGDAEKAIKKVSEIDIDNDGRKDMIILYDDDTVEFMKQYGGTPSYRRLGTLMNIVDGVDNLRVGDVNNDKLPDIFIKTKRNTLRVYQNSLGSFPTDGKAVCLDLPSWTKSLDSVWDLEVADMNNDGSIDLVTNDSRGQIRIFYGWSNWDWSYYVSNDEAWCDTNWFQRQKDHNLTVATFGFSLNEWAPMYDDSLVHRQGLTLPWDNATATDIPAWLQASMTPGDDKDPDPKKLLWSYDLSNLMNLGATQIIRYSGTPYDMLPVYETNTQLDKIAYIPSRYITGSDSVSTYKVYTKWADNTIKINVYIQAKQNTKVTYLEKLTWPWKVERNSDSSIVWFSSWSLVWLERMPSALVNSTNEQQGTQKTYNTPLVNWTVWNGFQFLIDNISLQAWQTISFSYPIIYVPSQFARIKVEDTNKDWRLDITTKSIDACSNANITYSSVRGKSYTTIKEQSETRRDIGKETQERAEKIYEAAKNGNVEEIEWLNDVLENWDADKSIIENFLTHGFVFNDSFDIGDGILWDTMSDWIDKTESTISTLTQWACRWFVSGGWGTTKWLPVPFNIALLAPWDINVFGCKVFEDKWLPIFAFPTTWLPPVWPINPTNAGWWFGGNASVSQIRIYVAPTLTMSVGVAVCLGPYAIGSNIPAPFKSIGGNCIVFAKRAGSSSSDHAPGGEMPIETTVSTDEVCSNPFPNNARPSSPIFYGVTEGGGSSSIDPNNIFVANNRKPASNTDITVWPTIPWGTYLWMINLDTSPQIDSAYSNTQADQLQGGKAIQLKIEWWNVNGLLKCVVQKWLDNQIRYIANNLTNMSINITIPDIGSLGEWFKNADYSWLGEVIDVFKKTEWWPSPASDALKDMISKSEGDSTAWVNQGDVTNLSAITSNPFNALSDWFDKVPMINVDTQNVTVQVPFIYSEELTKYIAQTQWYLKVLEQSARERERLIQDMAGTCSQIENELQRNACNVQLNKYINIKEKIWQLQRSIKSNLATLQAYKRFPASLKEWVTVNERYMQEFSDMVQWVTTDITWWLNVNASRFSAYVDSIILMVGAVKSWQAIIDFSTSRKSKCGKCTVDTYDYYSCVLWLLCPTLPVLAIPPFKIPNVYIDLSSVQMGIDVLLPNIRFVPKRVVLPNLPDLPAIPNPPSIHADFTIGWTVDVPTIPMLPAPPTLPELPSFIPSIDLNLPTLPPAPKIPNISPSISATLKVVSKIGDILCIVKNGISLVGESDVKTRIEQLTQRTRSVEPFDSLSVTRVTPPLRWFDIKVSTYLNFEFHFDWVYDVINNLAQAVNKKTNIVTDWSTQLSSNIEWLMSDVTEQIQNTSVDNSIEIKGSLWTDGLTIGATPILNSNVYTNNYKPKEQEFIDPSLFRERLQSEITAFKQSEYAIEHSKDIAAIQEILDTNTHIAPDYESLQKATNTLTTLVTEKKETMSNTKQLLNDYDSFLDTINSAALISDDSISWTISANLFTIDKNTKYIMSSAEHPLKTYLDIEDTLAKWFFNALENHSAEDLNMSIFTHDKLRTFFGNTRKDIQTAKWVIEPMSQNKVNTTPIVNAAQSVIQGADVLQTILAPKAQAATTATSQERIINPTNTQWKIRRDDNFVYTNQTTIVSQKNDGSRYSRYYLFKPIQHYRNFLDDADRNGYITVFNSAFNVASMQIAITNFQAIWQSNTTITVQRGNTKQGAYILSLENRIVDNHELDTEKKYIIAVERWSDLSKLYIDIDWFPNKSLATLTPQDNIIVMPIDTAGNNISLTIDLPEKKWSYIQIAQASITTRTNGDGSVIRKISPWSAQETLGAQRYWDTTWPTPTVQAQDRTSKEILATGINIAVPRKWSYDLLVTWEDDEFVIENTRNKSWESRIITSIGPKATIPNIPIAKDDTPLVYTISAIDQAWNRTTQDVTVRFLDPTITIESTLRTTGGFIIDSNLSTLYPDWFVRYYSTRDGTPSLLTGINGQQTQTDFGTRVLETQVTGGVFVDSDTISLFTAQKQLIAKIDKKTAQIHPAAERQDRLDLRIDTSNNIPIVLFIDKTTGTTLFYLYLRASSLTQVQSINKTYPLAAIPNTFPWTFGGGQCLQDTEKKSLDDCILYIASNWDVFMPDTTKVRFWWRYEYDWWVRYILTVDEKDALNILFTPIVLQ